MEELGKWIIGTGRHPLIIHLCGDDKKHTACLDENMDQIYCPNCDIDMPETMEDVLLLGPDSYVIIQDKDVKTENTFYNYVQRVKDLFKRWH